MTLKPSYGWGKEGLPEKGVGPNKTVTYEIKIISFEKAKESWQLDADAKLEQVKYIFNTNQHQEIDCLGQDFQRQRNQTFQEQQVRSCSFEISEDYRLPGARNITEGRRRN